MTLFEKINNDMISYMKSKDSFSLGVIRMVKGAIQLEKINKKRDLTDDEVVAVISKQIKMRNDSIEEFTKANRQDLIDQYQKEIGCAYETARKSMNDLVVLGYYKKEIMGKKFVYVPIKRN